MNLFDQRENNFVLVEDLKNVNKLEKKIGKFTKKENCEENLGPLSLPTLTKTEFFLGLLWFTVTWLIRRTFIMNDMYILKKK